MSKSSPLVQLPNPGIARTSASLVPFTFNDNFKSNTLGCTLLGKGGKAKIAQSVALDLFVTTCPYCVTYTPAPLIAQPMCDVTT